MADVQEKGTIDELREEVGKLSSQLENILKTVNAKNGEVASEAMDKLTRELESLRATATDRAHKAYDMGQAGLDEVGEQVRRNPLTSLVIAFGAGCVLSCLIRHLK